MSKFLPRSLKVNATRCPSGDQAGESHHPFICTRRRRLAPLVFITKIWGRPGRSDVNANCTPSGDRVGAVSTAAEGFGWPYRVAFSPDNALVLLPDLRNEELRFVERASRKELARVKLAGKGPQGIIFTPDGRHAFLSYSTAGKVAIIDIAGWRIAGEIPAGETPDGVAYSTRVLPKR